MTTHAGLAHDFNLYRPDLFPTDPTELYARFRAEEPVAWSAEFGGFWVVSRHEDIHRVLSHPEIFSSRQVTVPAVAHPDGPQLPLELDPPDHTEYRRILAPLFSPREVARLAESVHTSARDAIGRLARQGTCEFIAEYADVLPVRTFLEMLGAPVRDTRQLMLWKEDLIKAGLSGTEEGRRRRAAAVVEVNEYFERLLGEREAAADPPEDVLTGLVRGTLADGRRLRRDEQLRMCGLLMTAGLDTTSALLGLATEHLARRPRLRRELREHPEWTDSAAEELSRFSSLVSVGRIATTDTELGGRPIAAGDFVLMLTASAGRDEAQFPNADRIDLQRSPNRHLCYGAGPHRCVGSHLARLQVSATVAALRPYDFELDPARPMTRHVGYLMGLDELHLAFGSGDQIA